MSEQKTEKSPRPIFTLSEWSAFAVVIRVNLEELGGPEGSSLGLRIANGEAQFVAARLRERYSDKAMLALKRLVAGLRSLNIRRVWYGLGTRDPQLEASLRELGFKPDENEIVEYVAPFASIRTEGFRRIKFAESLQVNTEFVARSCAGANQGLPPGSMQVAAPGLTTSVLMHELSMEHWRGGWKSIVDAQSGQKVGFGCYLYYQPPNDARSCELVVEHCLEPTMDQADYFLDAIAAAAERTSPVPSTLVKAHANKLQIEEMRKLESLGFKVYDEWCYLCLEFPSTQIESHSMARESWF